MCRVLRSFVDGPRTLDILPSAFLSSRAFHCLLSRTQLEKLFLVYVGSTMGDFPLKVRAGFQERLVSIRVVFSCQLRVENIY